MKNINKPQTKPQNKLKELDMAKKAPLTDEVRQYFSYLGKLGGEKNKAKGSEYFSRISKLKAGKKYQKKNKLNKE